MKIGYLITARAALHAGRNFVESREELRLLIDTLLDSHWDYEVVITQVKDEEKYNQLKAKFDKLKRRNAERLEKEDE